MLSFVKKLVHRMYSRTTLPVFTGSRMAH